MTSLKLSAISLVCLSLSFLAGCDDELRIQNERQRKEIADLGSKVKADSLNISQLENKVNDADNACNVKTEALQQKVAAFEQDAAKKKELIESMSGQLLRGGMALPIELSTMLEDFAKTNPEMISFDSSKGLLKFKSDLLFDKGSDSVAPAAQGSLKSLSTILNSEEGKKFDIVIAGHTDDLPIVKPETREKHPTNWHLSVHRAIAVLKVLESSGVEAERMSARGFGEYRPIAPNAPGKKGNPQNRRVEIYLVPKGA
jgi:chemotaxis protein MotB